MTDVDRPKIDLARAVALAVVTIGRQRGLSDDELVQTLVDAGASVALARRIAVLLPMAFAEAILGGPGAASFAATFRVRDEAGQTTEHPLAEDPVFVQCLYVARNVNDRDVRLAVAERSAELDAINQALDRGSKLGDLTLSATIIDAAALPPYAPDERAPISYVMTELSGPSQRLRERLAEVLRAHGLELHATEVGFEVPDTLAVDGSVYSSRTGPGSYIVQLDVRLDAPMLAGRTLVESCAGVGSSIDDAVDDGLGKFCRGTLHPLLATLVDPSLGHDQVEWEGWGAEDRAWRVCMGPLLQQSTVPPGVSYAALLDDLRAQWLADESRPRVPHWIRVWLMMGPEQRFGAEVLLDNDPWREGKAALDAVQWPAVGQMYSLRHFMVLLPA